MLKFLQKFAKKKFLFYIGDSQTVVSLYKNKVLQSSFSLASVEDSNMAVVKQMLDKNSKVPIYIIADVGEQSFTQVDIPSKNPLVITKLLQRRISRDFIKTDIKSYFKIVTKDKAKTSYVVAAISNTPPISDWLTYLEKVKNPVLAVFSSAVEFQDMVGYYDRFLSKKRERVKDSSWKMQVIQNEQNGFRIIVTRDDQLVFTRLLNIEVQIGKHETVVELKNQILGTVEYLKRIGFEDRKDINLYLLFSTGLMKEFHFDDIADYNIYTIEHNEFLPSIIEDKKAEKGQSVENILCSFFLKHGRFIGFFTKDLKKLFLYRSFNFGLNLFNLGLLVFLVLFSVFSFVFSYTREFGLDDKRLESQQLLNKLESVRQKTFGLDVDEDKVVEVSQTHLALVSGDRKPLEYVLQLADLVPDYIKINGVNWKVSGKGNNEEVIFSVKGVFKVKDLSYEDLFIKYDLFIRNIKTKFSKDRISHSELPDTIDFDANIDDIPITFELKSKLNSKKVKGGRIL